MWRPDRHPGDDLSEQQVLELDALDHVLAGRPAAELDADHAPLVGLVDAVRDDHPPLRRVFADELGLRVSGGFARRGRHASSTTRSTPGPRAVRRTGGLHWVLRRAGRPQWLIGLGGAASVAVIALVIAAGFGSPPSPVIPGSPTSAAPDAIHATSAPGVGAAVPAASTPALGAPASGSSGPAVGAAGQGAKSGQSLASGGGSTPSIAQPAPVPSPLPAPGGQRAVESAASISLLAPRGQVQKVADGVIAAADRLGGIVASSNVTLGDQGGSQATIALAVPGASIQRTLAAISALAHVSARSQDTLDITDATKAARQRLSESQAERVALLRQLARASTPGQVASIHAQLGLVAGRITADDAGLRAFVHRATTASVNVTINESGRTAFVAGGSGWAPTEALAAALRVLEVVFAILVVALAVVVPAGALGALAWFSARAIRRRRREAALAA
ncbi:MAG: hypothetical protein QOH12_2433 [Solirubrobacteraceae bacterium]|jgi:hypothetical protein|nr:hypothetical protein [Solirubrobacteraceae bacterium]